MKFRNPLIAAVAALSLIAPSFAQEAPAAPAPAPTAAPVAAAPAPQAAPQAAPEPQKIPMTEETFNAVVQVIDRQAVVIDSQAQVIQLLVQAANAHEARIVELEKRAGIKQAEAKPTPAAKK